MREPIKNRYDFMLVLDCANGNPNGDPDAGNLPRTDPATQKGYITDVCLKRKVRNYVQAVKDGEPGYNIYVTKGKSLQSNDEEAFKAFGMDPQNQEDFKEAIKKAKKDDKDLDQKLMQFMADNFYDIRTFGAVMTTFVKNKLNWGQVTGPVQISFAESVDPVYPRDITISRVAVTKTEDLLQKKTQELGRKSMIPYGLYVAKGHISAHLAQKMTGFSEEDLELFWDALMNMFDFDHSAARGEMAVRDLIIFKHDDTLGNYPSHKLFDAVQIQKNEGVETPKSYADYSVTVNEDLIPEGVTLIHK